MFAIRWSGGCLVSGARSGIAFTSSTSFFDQDQRAKPGCLLNMYCLVATTMVVVVFQLVRCWFDVGGGLINLALYACMHTQAWAAQWPAC